MKGAVIYARYSCERQTEQSIEGQLRECYKYAEQNGLTIIHEYIDRAMTGTNDNRPSFQKMLADAERTSAWDIVLVYALDRFGRNSIEIALNKQKLIKSGKTLISATQRTSTNIDGSRNLDGILLENMYIGLAEYYSAELSQKIKRGLRESRLKGQFGGGGVAYGYKVVNKKLEINEEQAKIVKYIFERYYGGKIVREIIEELTARGVLYKNKPFVPQTVYKMLVNEKYIGITKYNGETFPNIYPPIIEKSLFDAIQQKLAINKCGKRSVNTTFALRNKVVCGYCGRNLQGDSSTARNGKLRFYYKCAGRKKHKDCNLRVIRQQELDDFVAQVTYEVFCTDENISLIADKVLEVQAQRNKSDSVLQMLHKRLYDTDKALTNVMSAIEQGIITKTTKERLAALENEKEDIETKIAVEETRRQKTFNKEEIERFLRTEFKDDPQLYLQHILDRVVVYDDKIEIFYKYTNTIPDDSDNECRGYFSSRCEIKINKAKRSMQVLDITIDQTIHFEILYVINRRHKLRFNLEKTPTTPHGAD